LAFRKSRDVKSLSHRIKNLDTQTGKKIVMIFNNNSIHIINIEDKISFFKDEIINDCMSQVFKRNLTNGFNFEIDFYHKYSLYNIFINESEKLLNKFTLKDNNFKLWCYLTNNDCIEGNKVWHNHTRTASINGVLYIKTQKNSGIEFEFTYIEPNDFDLLIFPGSLNHRPIISNKKPRISLNLELRCIESDYDIFNVSHKK